MTLHRYSWPPEKVAAVCCAAIAAGESMTAAVRAMNPGSGEADATNAIRRARRAGQNIPRVIEVWDLQLVAAVVCTAVSEGRSPVAAVQEMRDGCTVFSARNAIRQARRSGHQMPALAAPPHERVDVVEKPRPPSAAGPWLFCDCGHQVDITRAKDLFVHTLAVHDRRPSVIERTPTHEQRCTEQVAS